MTPEPLYAISLYQPWATLCVLPDPRSLIWPEKRYETRGWKPPARLIGRRVAVHAAATWTRRLAEFTAGNHFADLATGHNPEIVAEILRRHGIDPGPQVPPRGRLVRPLPLGAIVGTVVLARSLRCTRGKVLHRALLDARGEIAAEPGFDQLDLGDFSPGRYAWELHQPRPLAEPIPCRGLQRFWEVPAPIAAAIRESL